MNGYGAPVKPTYVSGLDLNLYFKNGKKRKHAKNEEKKVLPKREEATIPVLKFVKDALNRKDQELEFPKKRKYEEDEDEQQDEQQDEQDKSDILQDEDEIINDGTVNSVRYGSENHIVPNNFKDFLPEKEMKEWQNYTCVIYGRRGSGKSYILRDFLYKTRKWYDYVYSFSETSHLQPTLFDYIPKDNQRRGFDVEFLQKVMSQQESEVEMLINNGHEDKIKRILFIFDDVISDDRIRNCNAYNAIHTMGRHLRCACITLTQEVGGRYGLPKVVRDNCDLIIAFYAQNKIDREMLIDRYLSIENSKIGDAILKNITFEKFCSIAILNRKTARKYEDYVFKYKCDGLAPKFTIGSKETRKIENYTISTSKGIVPLFRLESLIQDRIGSDDIMI